MTPWKPKPTTLLLKYSPDFIYYEQFVLILHMLEMNGFRPDYTEAYWANKLSKKEVKTASGLFYLSYDVMRLHHRLVALEGHQRQMLKLGSNNDLELGYEWYGGAMDAITITAYRGMLSEELRLPRDISANTIDEPMMYIKNYRSLLFQRSLQLEEDAESYPELSENDIHNTAITVWRARSFK